MGNIVGGRIDRYVREQFKTRQEAHGSGSPNPSNTLRNNGQLSYLNSKTAFIKFASGVSISEEKLKTLSGGLNLSTNKGMGLARNNILFGGTSILPSGSSTLSQPSTADLPSGYTHSLEWGIVPMAGIESMDLKTMNRGSLEKATIKLKAYSREQFDIIDVLYLRLGYTVLLEWGNSIYLDNSGNQQKIKETLIDDNDKFFKNANKDSFHSLLAPIDALRGEHDGNYDGLIGKISNFNWSFNPDGSYDITVTVISLGSVVESIKSNLSPSPEYSTFLKNVIADIPEDTTIKNDIEAMLWTWWLVNARNTKNDITITLGSPPNVNRIGGWAEKGGSSISGTAIRVYAVKSGVRGASTPSIVAGIKVTDAEKQAIEDLKSSVGDDLPGYSVFKYEGNWTPPDFLAWTLSESAKKNIKWIEKKYYDKWGTHQSYKWVYYVTSWDRPNNPLKFEGFDESSSFFLDMEGPKKFYLRFGDLLKYIQSRVIPSIETTDDSEDTPILNIDTENWKHHKMYSLPNQISLDPRVCLVRNDDFKKSGGLKARVLPQLKPFRVEDYAPSVYPNAAYIFNIYLNFDFIKESLDSNTDEKGNAFLFNFIETLCEGLNKALGGINNLEPTVDKVTNEVKIIDSTPIPGLIKPPTTPPKPLLIYGYTKNGSSFHSNFVRNVNLKTAITPEYATMVTVGATAGGYVKGLEATAFANWNSGITDRFNSKLVNNISAATSSIDDAVTNYATKFLNYLNFSNCYGFQGLSTNTPGSKKLTFKPNIIDSNIEVGTEFFKWLQSPKSSTPNSGGSTGFIPFKMGLTLDGISGIKIYDKLEIDTKFLPSNYGKTLDLIVTGITHKLSNNDWETDIETTAMANSQEGIPNLDSVDFPVAAIAAASSAAASSGGPRSSAGPGITVTPAGGTGNTAIGISGISTPAADLVSGAFDKAGIQRLVDKSKTKVRGNINSSVIRSRIVEIAASYVGLNEIPGDNEGWFNADYQRKFLGLNPPWTPHGKWCVWFCQLVWKEAFTTGNAFVPSTRGLTFEDSYQNIWDKSLKKGKVIHPHTATLKTNFENFKGLDNNSHPHFVSRANVLNGKYTPKPGDIARYTYPGGGHVDIVVATFPGGYASIGGNTGAGTSGASRDGGKTKYFASKPYSSSFLIGFAVVPTPTNVNKNAPSFS